MFVQILPSDLLAKARRWDELKRWERREVGQELRRMGFSYREIASLIPVSKGTLSGWCRDIALAPAQEARLRTLHPYQFQRSTVGHVLRQRARARTEALREAGRQEARRYRDDPFWTAGVMAYWAEGGKRSNELAFSNSDPALIRFFLAWASRYLDLSIDRFSISLHLHAGQDDEERKAFWVAQTGLPLQHFRKTFIKPEGTGHRKNRLYNGTAQVRVRRSTALLHRVIGWIDGLSNAFIFPGYNPDGPLAQLEVAPDS